jgi:hypothetical protein
MTDQENLIDSKVAIMMLGITSNNLRQLVHRKELVTQGRTKRKSLFLLEDVQNLCNKRTKQPTQQ